MRRPSTSCCMSPTMAEVQTMPSWRLQGAPQVDLIISMKMRSENVSSEFAEFTSNDPMTALTTTSDLQSTTLQPLSPLGRSLHHTCALQRDSVCLNYPLTSVSPGEHCDQMSTMQPCIVLMCFLCLSVILVCFTNSNFCDFLFYVQKTVKVFILHYVSTTGKVWRKKP